MTDATTTTHAISEVDQDALERALAIMLRHRELGRDFTRRLDEGREPWADIARHAALSCQIASMGIKPWQKVPNEVEINQTDPPGDEHHRTRHASLTLERLLNAGLSRWEPDPAAAITAAETKKPAA
jgi:hypothetical protein